MAKRRAESKRLGSVSRGTPQKSASKRKLSSPKVRSPSSGRKDDIKKEYPSPSGKKVVNVAKRIMPKVGTKSGNVKRLSIGWPPKQATSSAKKGKVGGGKRPMSTVISTPASPPVHSKSADEREIEEPPRSTDALTLFLNRSLSKK